jgi:hypothetical protein
VLLMIITASPSDIPQDLHSNPVTSNGIMCWNLLLLTVMNLGN